MGVQRAMSHITNKNCQNAAVAQKQLPQSPQHVTSAPSLSL